MLFLQYVFTFTALEMAYADISSGKHFENSKFSRFLFVPRTVHLLSIYLNSRDPAPLNFTREEEREGDMKPPREWPWRRERGRREGDLNG